jgi:hypothetical protein
MRSLLLLSCVVTASPGAEEPQAPLGGAVKLEIDAAGVTVAIPGREPRRYSSLAELARAHPALQGEFSVAREAPAAGPATVLPADPERKGKTARIAQGEIAALELVRFLADFTGLPVAFEAGAAPLSGLEIQVPTAIPAADGQLVKGLLAASGVRVTERRLPDGQRLLEISAPAPAPGEQVLQEVPVLRIGPEAGSRRGAEEPAGLPRGTRQALGFGAAKARYATLLLEPVPEILLAQIDLPAGRGLLVSDIDLEASRGRPDLAVLRRHDIITHIGETPIDSPERLADTLNGLAPGETFRWRLLRKGVLVLLNARR